MKTVLQVSLNSLDLQEALSIAEKAANEGITWIEVGSSLIKVAGLASISELRRRYPDSKITADMIGHMTRCRVISRFGIGMNLSISSTSLITDFTPISL